MSVAFDVSRIGNVTIAKLKTKVNVITDAFMRELHAILDSIQGPDAAFVLYNDGAVFSAGADLKVVSGGGDGAADYFKRFNEMMERIRTCPFVTAVFAQGKLIAGGVILFCCFDYRFASSNCTFYLNETDNGMEWDDFLATYSLCVTFLKALRYLGVLLV
jgi:enoyl-CoA hydratase/carnithine racemase